MTYYCDNCEALIDDDKEMVWENNYVFCDLYCAETYADNHGEIEESEDC